MAVEFTNSNLPGGIKTGAFGGSNRGRVMAGRRFSDDDGGVPGSITSFWVTISVILSFTLGAIVGRGSVPGNGTNHHANEAVYGRYGHFPALTQDVFVTAPGKAGP